MKKVSLILVFAISLLTGLTGCDDRYLSDDGKKEKVYSNYTEYTTDVMNSLKPPIILIGKTKDLGSYSVVLKDSTKKIVFFGNMSTLADAIGESHKIGDTIVK